MERRVGQLAGIIAFALVIARLDRLLQSDPAYPQWRLILLASVVLGGVVWWLLSQLFQSRWVAAGGLVATGLILFLRIAVPETLAFGVVPTADTFAALMSEMNGSLRLIQSGVPPVIPRDGVVAILAIVVWLVGALHVWGLTGGPVAAMVIPPMVLYLQFAVFDRQIAGLGWMGSSALMLALAITALGLERKRDAGRVRDPEGRPKTRRSLALAIGVAATVGVFAVGMANAASSAVSEYGNYPWRNEGGYGSGAGGIYDPFVGLRQRLRTPTDAVLFKATLGLENSDRAESLFWRMEALDEFDGIQWGRSSDRLGAYQAGRPVGEPDHLYQGTTIDVLQRVVIEGLGGILVPTAGLVNEVHEINPEGAINPNDFSVTSGAAIVYTPGLSAGDQYQLSAQYSLYTEDLGALATDDTGNLSPIFAGAAAAGKFNGEPATAPESALSPDDLEFFTELPDNTPATIRGIALQRTSGAVTDFEKAWMLQAWFRDSGDFTYSLDVTTGNSALVLENWLADPTSLNYRIGYCEQFAASMGVLGRALGIPTRVVWGFTPGEVVEENVNGETIEVIEVKDLNAHAWVEMWMEGFGWVQFDPTPRGGDYQPESLTASFDPTDFLPEEDAATVRSNSNLLVPVDPGSEPFVDQAPTEFSVPEQRWWFVAALGLVLLAGVTPFIKWQRRRRRIVRIKEGDITAAWDELVDRLSDLGSAVPPAMTPVEFARSTDSTLVHLATNYSATIYGGYQSRGDESDLYAVDGFVENNYDGLKRTRAAFNPRSLFRRD